MTEVAFHTGVADKLGYACRLLRKAWRSGARVVATGAPETLARLDALLWTFEQEEFLPHARLRAGERVAPVLARTPLWLADAPGDLLAGEATPPVLVNLGPAMVDGFERFARVLELVSDDPEDARLGRQRWRQYQAAGVTPRLHAQAGSEAR